MSAINDQLCAAFKSRTILCLKDIQKMFPDRSSRSLVRDLEKIGIITSFTHSGQYRVIKNKPNFDNNGLWFFKDVGFSKFYTLKATIVELIQNSNAGYTHKELTLLLKIKTHNTLKELVSEDKITRRQLPNRLYVYLHVDIDTAQQQFDVHLSLCAMSNEVAVLPEPSLIIDVLVEVIRCCKVGVEPNVVFENMRKKGVKLKESVVEWVFSKYSIKKKRI